MSLTRFRRSSLKDKHLAIEEAEKQRESLELADEKRAKIIKKASKKK